MVSSRDFPPPKLNPGWFFIETIPFAKELDIFMELRSKLWSLMVTTLLFTLALSFNPSSMTIFAGF